MERSLHASLGARGGFVAAIAAASVLLAAHNAFAADTALKFSYDFEHGLGNQRHASWSDGAVSRTPTGRMFHGPFSDSEASLRLVELPPHTVAIVTFDLYIIGPWDGQKGQRSSETNGDIFGVRVSEGPDLLRASFSVPRPGAPRQSYPREVTGLAAESAAGTGASEFGTLGYTSEGEPMDNVYSLRYRFAHTKDSLTLTFQGEGLDEATEFWGLDNVDVIFVDEHDPAGDPGKGGFVTDETFAASVGDGLLGGSGELGTNPPRAVPLGSDFSLMPNGGGSNPRVSPPQSDINQTNHGTNSDTHDQPPPPPPPSDDDDDDHTPPPVPTPGTLSLAIAGSVLLARRMR